MKTEIVTAPTQKPVSIADVKTFARIDIDDEDHLIDALIDAASAHIEGVLWRRLLTQTWRGYLENWPNGNAIILPFGRLQSVTSVKYTDTDGTEETFSSDSHHVDTVNEPGAIVLKYGESWPSVSLATSNPIEIEFVCGYGDERADIPEPIKTAIKLFTVHLLENRDVIYTGPYEARELPMSVTALMQNYRLMRF